MYTEMFIIFMSIWYFYLISQTIKSEIENQFSSGSRNFRYQYKLKTLDEFETDEDN